MVSIIDLSSNKTIPRRCDVSRRQEILITGANGQLGQLVVQSWSRSPRLAGDRACPQAEAAAALAALGVEVRIGSYDDPASWTRPSRASTFMLISSSEVGKRLQQHEKSSQPPRRPASFPRLPSICLPTPRRSAWAELWPRKSGSPLLEHPYAFLRNGWYIENLSRLDRSGARAWRGGRLRRRRPHLRRLPRRLCGSAAVVLANSPLTSMLCGARRRRRLHAYGSRAPPSRSRPASLSSTPICRKSPIRRCWCRSACRRVFAGLLADSDVGASKGGLFDDSKTLSRIIGRPTTPLKTVLRRPWEVSARPRRCIDAARGRLLSRKILRNRLEILTYNHIRNH